MNGTPVWRCGAFRFDLTAPVVMGVLNVTPDSFSDGGRHEDPVLAVMHGLRMVEAGAAIIDVGGESTRPGAQEVAPAAEVARARPVVRRLADEAIAVSIDTRHAEVARACVGAGACIVNDVTGFRSEAMVDVAATTDAGLVIMHMQGEPQTMQVEPHYRDVVGEVGGFLLAQAAVLEKAGVDRERIVLDPGIGFGKTLEHNIALLRGLPTLSELGYPLLVGVSRKRFIGELSGAESAQERLGGSVAAALAAVRMGVAVVRVHDVAETVQALAVQQAIAGA